ncbi:MAG: PilZ domain-containing protein [Spirochaetaceae bacterium]|jgi:hypothetical protein|nr:PilZ domain-containing protein [Spirochaetaceae bacterium]
MSDENTIHVMEKKIFFLYPSKTMISGVIEELVQQEYEVYIIHDHKKLRNILKKCPDAIVFVNIDEGLSPQNWETWICGIMQDPGTAKVRIGVLTAVENEAAERKYTSQVCVPCGFTVVKSDFLPAAGKLYALLQSLNARGRRKYIRVNMEDIIVSINIPHNGGFIEGVVKDLSVIGLSCFFNPDPELEKNSLCQNIQVKLGSTLLKAEGIVFGSRADESVKVYVFLFTQRTDPNMRARIRRFNQSVLQSHLDAF